MPNVGRNQTPEPEPRLGRVKMKNILSLSSDRNEVDRIMEMKLYHKWELNEMGGLGLYSRIGSHHKKAFLEDSLCHCINMYYCGNHFLTIFIVGWYCHSRELFQC